MNYCHTHTVLDGYDSQGFFCFKIWSNSLLEENHLSMKRSPKRQMYIFFVVGEILLYWRHKDVRTSLGMDWEEKQILDWEEIILKIKKICQKWYVFSM